jgi:predicted adenylyl cyclase CyaB
MTSGSEWKRNLEIKARCSNLAEVRRLVVELCGETGHVEQQCDTYFHFPLGRLKLREIEGQPAVLIDYSRPNEAAARTSQYRLMVVAHPDTLKAGLEERLGIRGVVHKRREMFLWQNVRIHLDRVQGLGEFVEFEAVLADGDDASSARGLLAELCGQLRLDASQFLAGSYADLLGY